MTAFQIALPMRDAVLIQLTDDERFDRSVGDIRDLMVSTFRERLAIHHPSGGDNTFRRLRLIKRVSAPPASRLAIFCGPLLNAGETLRCRASESGAQTRPDATQSEDHLEEAADLQSVAALEPISGQRRKIAL